MYTGTLAFIMYTGQLHTSLKLGAFVESELSCSYNLTIQKKEKFRIRIIKNGLARGPL